MISFRTPILAAALLTSVSALALSPAAVAQTNMIPAVAQTAPAPAHPSGMTADAHHPPGDPVAAPWRQQRNMNCFSSQFAGVRCKGYGHAHM